MNIFFFRISAMMLVLAGSLVSCSKDVQLFLKVGHTPNYSFQAGERPGEIDVNRFMVVVKEGSNIEQNLHMTAIKNFSYEKGYEYLLKVKKTSKNDKEQYSLIEIVSKTLTGEAAAIVLLNVTSEVVHPLGTGGEPTERIVVSEEGDSSPLTASFKIEGFVYERGFDYLLRVRKTVISMPVTVGFGFFHLYEFIEIVSKEPT